MDTSILNSNGNKRKQIIMSTLQEIRKELNYDDNVTRKKQKSPKRKKLKRQNEELQEEENSRNSKSLTRTQIIKSLLDEKRKELGQNKTGSGEIKRSNHRTKTKDERTIKENTNKDTEAPENKIESKNNLSLKRQLLNDDGSKQSMQIPEITNHHWKKFRKDLELHQDNYKVKRCLDKMHGYRLFDLHFTTLHFIRQAIVDSLLNRKWDNLVKLLVMLIKNYSDPVFTVFIRHMCEILKHYHPKIRGTELEHQIELIMEKYENLKSGRHSIINNKPN